MMLPELIDDVDRLVTRAGPLTAALAGCGLAVSGILIIVFPVLLAWIVGLSLILGGLIVFGSIALRVKWDEAPVDADARARPAGEERSQPSETIVNPS